MITKYFLGSNSHNGFVSFFDEMFKDNENSHIYILKGGAGCGKSNLMKKFAEKFKNSEDTELIHCCSDITSLDAVIFPNKKIAVVDGTPPHVLEPRYPCLREEIVWLAEYVDRKKLLPHNDEIVNLMAECKNYHKEADSFLFVAGEFIKEINKLGENLLINTKSDLFIQKTAKKLLIKNEAVDFSVKKRLLSAITDVGKVDFNETVSSLCDNIYIIEDKYYAFANRFMNNIYDFAKNYACDIIVSYSPYFPQTMINAIIFKNEKLAFVVRNTKNDFVELNGKTISSLRFYNTENVKTISERIKFMRKSIKLCQEDAVKMIAKAKTIHDKLEKYYIDAMDYDELNKKTDFLLESCEI